MDSYPGICERKISLLQKINEINPILQKMRRNCQVKHMDLKFFMTSDNFPLFYRLWYNKSDIKPKKIVVCLHGLHSHSEKFVFLADEISNHEDWYTYGIDLRGHGLSWNESENKGDIPDFEIWIKDVDEFIKKLSKDYPKVPIYLVGESMGGALAIHIAKTHPPDLKGLVLFSPAIKPWREVQFGMIMEAFTYAIFSHIDEEVIPNKGKLNLGTNSDEYIEYQLKDPLRMPKMSPRYYFQIIKMIHVLKNYDFKDFYPTSIFFGGKDHLISFSGIRKFIKKLGMNDKALHYIPAAYHDLISDEEADKYRMLKKARHWILHH